MLLKEAHYINHPLVPKEEALMTSWMIMRAGLTENITWEKAISRVISSIPWEGTDGIVHTPDIRVCSHPLKADCRSDKPRLICDKSSYYSPGPDST